MASAVDLYVELMENAYSRPAGPDGDGHSLLANLATVPPEAWDTVPEGLARCVRAIALHVGSCKYMYADHAFGTATMLWDSPPVRPEQAETMPLAALLAWIDASQRFLLDHVQRLTDETFDSLVATSWGERWPARRILQVMIEHDHYHAGEVNHLRSLIIGNDRWAFADD
jgi:uncharacterized damage-inducible protein DinB